MWCPGLNLLFGDGNGVREAVARALAQFGALAIEKDYERKTRLPISLSLADARLSLLLTFSATELLA